MRLPVLVSLALLAALTGCDAPRSRAPLELARYYSEMTIPPGAEVLNFTDDFRVEPGDVMSDEGIVSVELRLPAPAMRDVYASAMRDGFKPIQGTNPIEFNTLQASRQRSGVYKMTVGQVPENVRIVVLDTTDSFMWVYYRQTTQTW